MSNKRYEVNTPGVSPVDRDVTKLLYVSTAKYGGDWHSLMHTHACTELFYVVGGMGQFKVAEKLIPVSPDDLVIVNPNVEHTEVSLNASPLEYIVLGVEGMEFAADENGDRRYSAFNFHSGREDILPYLRGMLREIEQKSAGYEVVCQDLLEVLVVKLMRHTDFSLTVTPAQQSSKECAEARRYIDSNFKENISLDQLAELTHVNKYYLVHSFSKEYGVSPINYLIGRRIEESRYLLADTNHSRPRSPTCWVFPPPVTSPRVSVSWKASALWNTGSGSGPRGRDIRNNNSCTFVHLSLHNRPYML